MRSSLISLVVFASALVGCSNELFAGSTWASEATTPEHCAVSGAGTLDPPPAAFSGSATVLSSGDASGAWTHRVLAGTETVCTPSDDCPGNGRRVGHQRHRGRGHDIGRGRGHCEHTTVTCEDVPVYDELIGTFDGGTCLINGSALGLLSGSGTWNGAPATFTLNLTDSALLGDNYELEVSDSSGVVYYVNDSLASGDVSVTSSP